MTASGERDGGQSYVERPPVAPLAAFVFSVWINHAASFVPLLRSRPH